MTTGNLARPQFEAYEWKKTKEKTTPLTSLISPLHAAASYHFGAFCHPVSGGRDEGPLVRSTTVRDIARCSVTENPTPGAGGTQYPGGLRTTPSIPVDRQSGLATHGEAKRDGWPHPD